MLFSKSANTSQSNFILNLYINSKRINQVSISKYLGVVLDSRLDWQDQINILCNKLVKFIPLFYRIRKHLPFNLLRTLYFAFVYPILTYGIELFGYASDHLLNKLNVINNKLLRILQFRPIQTNSLELYKLYNTLPISKLYQFKLILFTHSWVYRKAKLPECFHNLFNYKRNVFNHYTRNNSDLFVVRCKSSLYQKSFKFNCVKFWNGLPRNIKSIENLNNFKSSLYNYLINS